MGATPYNKNSKIYYNVNGHLFTKRAQEGQDGAVMRKVSKKDGSTKEVWEFLFKDLSGLLKSIDIKDTDWGKQYEITLEDNGEEMVLQLNVESGYGDTFANRILNIVPGVPVRLEPYSFIPENASRKKDGINIFQNKTKIEPKYTRENPMDMPSVEKLQDAGVMSDPPDGSDWKVFYGLIHKFFTGKVAEFAKTIENQPATSEAASTPEPEFDGNSTDDLPFSWTVIPLIGGALSGLLPAVCA